MRELPRWVRAVLVGQFVNAVGALAWLFVTLYLVQDRGLSPATAGAVVSAYGVGTILGNLAGGSVGDRLGLRPTLVLALTGSAAGCLLVPVVPTGALAVVLPVTGLVGGLARPVYAALVASSLPVEQRRQGIALSRAFTNAGTVIGPPVGGLLAAWRFDLLFVVDAASSLVMLVVVLRWVPAARRPVDRGGPRSVRRALRADPRMVLLLVTVLVTDTAYRLMYTTLPLQLRDDGVAPVVYGALISVNGAVIVLLEPWLARRLRHRAPQRLVALGFALVGAGWLVLAGGTSVLAGAALVTVAAVVSVLVVTAGEMLYKPTATAHAADRAPEGMHGRYQSLYGAAALLAAAGLLEGWRRTIEPAPVAATPGTS